MKFKIYVSCQNFTRGKNKRPKQATPAQIQNTLRTPKYTPHSRVRQFLKRVIVIAGSRNLISANSAHNLLKKFNLRNQ